MKCIAQYWSSTLFKEWEEWRKPVASNGRTNRRRRFLHAVALFPVEERAKNQ